MSYRLFAPGTRKRNPYWIVRAFLYGRGYEISSKTKDEAEAHVVAEQFEAAVDRQRALEEAERAAAAISVAECFVYFIASADGRVKIGSSAVPERRLAALQTGSGAQLRLLGTIAGNYEDEKNLHHRFAGYRLRGEWFEIAGELRFYLRNLFGEPQDG